MFQGKRLLISPQNISQAPFRSDVACQTQARPDLRARTGPAPTQTASKARAAAPKATSARKINAQLKRRAKAFERKNR